MDIDQLEIPGTERPKVPAVEAAAAKLRSAEQAAHAHAELLSAAREALLFSLIEAGVRDYKYADPFGGKWTIEAKTHTTVKIKRGHE